MLPQEPWDEFEIDEAAVWPVEDAHLEPVFLPGPLFIDFADGEPVEPEPAEWGPRDPLLVDFNAFAEFDDLDDRREEPADEPLAAHPGRQRVPRGSALSLLGSVGVHLVVLLAFLGWSRPLGEASAPIPVRLVIEQHSATAAPQSDASDTAGRPPPPAAPPPPEPAVPQKVAAVVPTPPKPAPMPADLKPAPEAPPQRVEAKPRPPAPERRRTRVAVAEPPPSEAPLRPRLPPMPVSPASEPARPTAAPAPQSAPGMGMSREQYFAYLVTLTRQHLDLLPQSLVGGRRGRTLVSVLVMRDGTIAHVGIAEGSGYPDIDSRIERMVSAVGRFPPLPPSFQGPSAQLDLKLLFPDVYQR